jgi:hypothetical protein
MHPISQTPVRTAQRLKICHLVATTEGATWMLEQLRELRDQYGFEVVAVVSGEKGSLNDKLDAENIRYHVANFTGMRKSLKALLQTPGAVLKLARFFRRERFDVVQTHIFVTMLTGRPAAWLADVPVRTAMIASPFHLGTYTFRWIERLTYWMDTVLIPSCEFSVSLCRELGIPEKRISPVIYYSPDERRFDPEKELPANIRAGVHGRLLLPPAAARSLGAGSN